MPLTTDQITQALPLLTQTDLEQIRQRCVFLLTPAGGRPRLLIHKPEESFAAELYGALADEIKRKTSAASMPWAIFQIRQRKAYEKYTEIAADVKAMNTTWFPSQNQAQRMSILALYAQLVIATVLRSEQALVWDVISYQLGNLGGIIESAYPGYAASGLLNQIQIIRTSTSGRTT